MQTILDNIQQIPTMGATADDENPTAWLKFYNTLGKGEWYIIEMTYYNDDVLFFGYVVSPLGDDCDEFGSFTLSELLNVGCIDLDFNFKPKPIKELVPN